MITLPANCTIGDIARAKMAEFPAVDAASYGAMYRRQQRALNALDKAADGRVFIRLGTRAKRVNVGALLEICPTFFATEIAAMSDFEELAERVALLESGMAKLLARVAA